MASALLLGGLVALAAASPMPAGQRAEALPCFALDFAPHIFLHSKESWWPSNVSTHLENVVPEKNFTALGNATAGSVTLDNLSKIPSDDVYLTAAKQPAIADAWANSTYGKPNNVTGLSGAPGTIIAVNKPNQTTDVFYFTFFSYNFGQPLLSALNLTDIPPINFDDHVGDWEHIMVRFIEGKPTAIWYSQHATGSAYKWDVPKFIGNRPVAYIAQGSHANYIKPGVQKYTPLGELLVDETDAGFYWDMTKNFRGYTYDTASGKFASAGGAGIGGESKDDASWLEWEGRWGDEQLPASAKGQLCLGKDLCVFTSGPTGPVAKNLKRKQMCNHDDDTCKVYSDIDGLTLQEL